MNMQWINGWAYYSSIICHGRDTNTKKATCGYPDHHQVRSKQDKFTVAPTKLLLNISPHHVSLIRASFFTSVNCQFSANKNWLKEKEKMHHADNLDPPRNRHWSWSASRHSHFLINSTNIVLLGRKINIEDFFSYRPESIFRGTTSVIFGQTPSFFLASVS